MGIIHLLQDPTLSMPSLTGVGCVIIGIIGSLRNHDGDGQRRLKMNLYFTYEFRDTLKSFSLFLTVKIISKLNLGHSDKFKIEI